MRKKRITVLLMTAMLVVASWPGKGVTYAADIEQTVEKEQKESKPSEGTLMEEAENTENVSDPDVAEAEEIQGDLLDDTRTDETDTSSHEVQTQADSNMDGIKVETLEDGTVQVTADGVESAMPGIIDLSEVTYHEGPGGGQEVATRTWNQKIKIVLKNGKPGGSAGQNNYLGGLDCMDTVKGQITYIFNQPVEIIVENTTANDAIGLIRGNQTSNYVKWIFNDTVDFTVRKCSASYINGGQVLAGHDFYTEYAKNWGVVMRKPYTMNVEDCTNVLQVNGGAMKERGRNNKNQKVIDDYSCGFDEGLTMNIRNTQVKTGIVAGHTLVQGTTDYDPDGTQYRYWTKGPVVVNLYNSSSGAFASSMYTPKMAGKTDIEGKVTVNLYDGSTITMAFGRSVAYGNPAAATKFVGAAQHTQLNFSSGAQMAALAGFDEIALAGKVDVSVLFFPPTSGMKLNVAEGSKWNEGDVMLTYAYLKSPAYVKCDENLISSNWENKNLHLQYQDISGTKTQQWYVNRDVTVTFDSKGGTTVPSQTFKQGGKATQPAVTKEYAVFEGWYTTEDFRDGTAWDFNKTVDDDMTLYAKWRADTANVKVSEKDGNKEYGTITVDKGTPITGDKLSTVNVEKKGYTVEKWTTSAGKDWDIENDNVTADMEIHPVWKLNAPQATLGAENNITTVHIGDTVKLTAQATHEAEGNITYQFQWFKDGKEIKANKTKSKATARAVSDTSELVVDESGEYSVKVLASDGAQTAEAGAGPVSVTVTPHQFGGDWKHDAKDHWHECTIENCGVKDQVEAHIFSEWTVVKEATTKEQGERERSCTTCGYKETEKIPMTENEAPVISAKDKDITVGDTFDVKADVKATDKEDGDLTDKIEVVKNTVDTSKAGTYEVTYQVTDTDGATTTLTIKVVVKAKTADVPKNPEDNSKTDTGKTDHPKNETRTVETKVTTSTTQTPKTGDGANAGLAWVGLVVGIMGVAEVLRRKKDMI